MVIVSGVGSPRLAIAFVDELVLELLGRHDACAPLASGRRGEARVPLRLGVCAELGEHVVDAVHRAREVEAEDSVAKVARDERRREHGNEDRDQELHVLDVVVEMKGALGQRHHARVGPVGDEDLVVMQQTLHRVAQQRGMVTRQRCHHQHRRLLLHGVECAAVVGEALEAQQPTEGLLHRHLLLHGDLHVRDQGRGDAEWRLFVFLGQAVQQVETGRNALGQWELCKRRQRVVVELGGSAGELREGRHQCALGLVDLVKHQKTPIRWAGSCRKSNVALFMLQCSNVTGLPASFLTSPGPAPRPQTQCFGCSGRRRRCDPTPSHKCRTRCADAASAPCRGPSS